MKISKDVIDTFRLICKGEKSTPTKDIIFKLTRNFTLGKVVETLDKDTYFKQYGDLKMLYCKGKIINIYHDKSGTFIKSSNRDKYAYNELNGRSDLNAKYNRQD